MHFLFSHEYGLQLCLCQCQPFQLRKASLHQGKTQQYLLYVGILSWKNSRSLTHRDLDLLSVHRRRLLPLQPRQQRRSLLQIVVIALAVRLYEFIVRSASVYTVFGRLSGDGPGASADHPFPSGRWFLRPSGDGS